MTSSRRVGILGGTFDPIHCGHLDAGSAAEQALGLDAMLVLPSNIPPHRPPPVASGYHRFAMVALAIAGRRKWQAMDLELREGTRSFTSDTLRRLQRDGFGASELFFIAGADAFVDIATWKDYPAVLDLANFAVISRPGITAASVPDRLPALAGRMRKPGGAADASTVIFLIDAPTADVSSTAIRGACARDESIAEMVPPGVQQHIDRHALYRHAEAPGDSGTRPAKEPADRLHGQD